YEGPERTNKYWEYFVAKIPPGYYSGEPTEDLLYLVCSNTYYIEELFEKFDDAEGLQLLQRAELECC
ncbi:MAG: N(2)-fixation sustaining protein CowN, partial [Azospira sp.]|nr:N(2)-fixation sustaining protein CowN [Azospira sp.]